MMRSIVFVGTSLSFGLITLVDYCFNKCDWSFHAEDPDSPTFWSIFVYTCTYPFRRAAYLSLTRHSDALSTVCHLVSTPDR